MKRQMDTSDHVRKCAFMEYKHTSTAAFPASPLSVCFSCAREQIVQEGPEKRRGTEVHIASGGSLYPEHK